MKFVKLVLFTLLLACFARLAAGNNSSEAVVRIVEEQMDEIIVIHGMHTHPTEPEQGLVPATHYRVFFIRNGQIMATRIFYTHNEGYDIRYSPIWSRTEKVENGKRETYFLLLFDENAHVDKEWSRIGRAIYTKRVTFMTIQDFTYNPGGNGQWWNQNKNMRDLKQP